MGQYASPKNGLQDDQGGRQKNVRKDGLAGKRKINYTEYRSKELMFAGSIWITVPACFLQPLALTGEAGELLLKSSKEKDSNIYRMTGHEKARGNYRTKNRELTFHP